MIDEMCEIRAKYHSTGNWILGQLVSCVLRRFGFPVHLQSIKVTMNRKSSVIQILKSVPQVLTSDRETLSDASANGTV